MHNTGRRRVSRGVEHVERTHDMERDGMTVGKMRLDSTRESDTGDPWMRFIRLGDDLAV